MNLSSLVMTSSNALLLVLVVHVLIVLATIMYIVVLPNAHGTFLHESSSSKSTIHTQSNTQKRRQTIRQHRPTYKTSSANPVQ